jgi:hypothetical protein
MSGVAQAFESGVNPSAPQDGISNVPADDLRPDGPISGRPDPEEMLPRIVGWYKAARDHWQEQRQEMAEMFDFRAGHQWSDEDLQILSDQMRPTITFNRVGPFVDAVGGLEINNRQETVFIPRQVGASGVNDLLTSAGQWVRQECDAEDEETEAFLDMVTAGWGWIQTRLDYDDDPDGMIVMERIDPLEMFPDAAARKQNLADRRHQLRVKDIPIGAAEEMFPDVDPMMLHAQWAEDQPDATRQPHNARLAPYYRIDQSADVDRTEQMVRMVEVEWWDYQTAYRVFDAVSGRWVLLDETKARIYRLRSAALGVRPMMRKDRRKKYWKAIVGAEVLKIMDGPEKGGFQYKCMTGKRDQNKGTWYGIVRAMRDPQQWANKWVSQGLHIFNTNAKGGLIVEEDAVADMDELRDSWADADSITVLNPGAMSKFQPKQPAQFPQQLNQMMEFAIDSIPQVSGINMELMGQSTSQQPQVALLEAGRRQQGMNVLAGLFNAKRRYHKEQGRLCLWFIQEYIADGRLILIGGPDQRQYVPLIHDPNLAEYDVIVDDAPTSPNMKDKVWGSLMQLFPMLRGMQIPPQLYIEALQYSPVPASFAQKMKDILSQPPPPNAGQQAEQALNQARTQLVGAQAQKTAAEANQTQVETQKTQVETAMLPHKADSEVTEREARIESLRANSAAALAKAGITADDMKFQQTMAAVDALLRVHGAALDHAQAVTQNQAAMMPQQPQGNTAPPG